MLNREKWHYIDYRLRYLILTGQILMALLAIAAISIALKQGSGIALICFLLVLLAADSIALVKLVYLPYQEINKRLQLLFTGYTASGLYDMPCALSATTEQLIHTVTDLLDTDELLNSSKRQAQYLALQNQINPHFLYNTLESIRSEAMEVGLDSVADMTEALATFFRYTISKVENMVSLEEEIHNIETYLYIQRYRFGDRLHLRIDTDSEEIKSLYQYLLPKLTLQPIVENAIIHGIEKKMGDGTVSLQLTTTEKRLIITVSDDGVGMPKPALEMLNHQLSQSVLENARTSHNKKGGIALVNVNNRIRLIFGEEYGLTVYSTPGVGTDMVICLPKITNERQLQKHGELT